MASSTEMRGVKTMPIATTAASCTAIGDMYSSDVLSSTC